MDFGRIFGDAEGFLRNFKDLLGFFGDSYWMLRDFSSSWILEGYFGDAEGFLRNFWDSLRIL